jgi:TRAP-type C4-dicarboxylate transport system substrate-binding protein
LDSQPFVATSYADAQKLWAAQKPAVTELLAKQNLIPLFSVPWPPQGLYTKGEIKSVAYLKGLKFRAYNAALEKFAQLAGAAPTQVEAMITSPSTGANTKAWDYVSHYTAINAWVPKNIVVVNKSAFEALDAATQKAVQDAAMTAEVRGWELSKQETESKTAALKEGGMTIVEPSAELIEGLKEIGSQMQVEWQANASAEARLFNILCQVRFIYSIFHPTYFRNI